MDISKKKKKYCTTMSWRGFIIHHISVIVNIFTFKNFSTPSENCHSMIILRSRYIMWDGLSLSSLVSFSLSEMCSRGFTALAGTRWVDWWELFRQTFVLQLFQKWKTLKNVLCHLLIYFLFVLLCHAQRVNLFITCLNKKRRKVETTMSYYGAHISFLSHTHTHTAVVRH